MHSLLSLTVRLRSLLPPACRPEGQAIGVAAVIVEQLAAPDALVVAKMVLLAV